MQQMMSAAGGMDPAVMQQQMRMMQNMSPADMERAKQQIDSMDPSTIASQAQEAQKVLSAQQKYIFDVSGRSSRTARLALQGSCGMYCSTLCLDTSCFKYKRQLVSSRQGAYAGSTNCLAEASTFFMPCRAAPC